MTRTIEKNGVRLAIWFSAAEAPAGLAFMSADADFLQVGSWRYPAGKQLAAHNHNIVSRPINRTQELAFVAKGAVEAAIYDEEDQLVEKVRLNPLEGLILLAGGHGYTILEEDTIVVETKNGPYPGAEADRRRLFE